MKARIRMSDALSGLSLSDPQPVSAVSRNGICCYMEILKELNCQAERLCRAHLLAGQIHCKNRRYHFVQEGDVLGSQVGGREDLEDATVQEPSTSIPDVKPDPEIIKVDVLASERAPGTAITFVYRVTLPNSSHYIGPVELTRTVLESTGLITCQGLRCKYPLAIPSHHVVSGWSISSDNPQLKFQAGVARCIWTYENDVSRALAIVLHLKRHGTRGKAHEYVFLRRNECFPCCTKSVLESSGWLLDRRSADSSGQSKAVVHVI